MKTELILHHYPASPFSEKIRLVMGMKELTWKSVIIPSVMPKPDLVALTGGYRRTPVLQIGADIYCDSSLICEVLEHIKPEPVLYPPHLKGVSRVFAQWADSALFSTAMAWNLQPKGMEALFAKLTPEASAEFVQDRLAMHGNLPRISSPDAAPAYRSYLRRIAHMVEEHDFLFGSEPCVADLAAYHPLWFTRVCTPSVADIFDHVPSVLEWMDRIATLEYGRMEKFTADEAIAVAARSEPLRQMSEVFQDEHGIALGSAVTVTPDSFTAESTSGALVGASRTRYTVRREDPRAGTVFVHFPRIGYALRNAEA